MTGAGAVEEVSALRCLRWAVRAILTTGVAASVAANTLHARPNPVSQAIAAWSPVALLLTVEMISRVPIHRRGLGVLRLTATVVVAAIAAWVSYWHMAGVAAHYGEHGAIPYLLPFSVDGLVLVATISLVEITGRIRAQPPRTGGKPQQPRRVPALPRQPLHPSTANPATTAETSIRAARKPDREPSTEWAPQPAAANIPENDRSAADQIVGHRSRRLPPQPDTPPTLDPTASQLQRSFPAAADTQRARPILPQHPDRQDLDDGFDPTNTAAAVAYWRLKQPHLHPSEIAARIHKSERTVRRISADLPLWNTSTPGPQHCDKPTDECDLAAHARA